MIRLIGFVWCFPLTVLAWIFYILPALAIGAISYGSSPRFLVWIFYVEEGGPKWHLRAWEGWAGIGLPCAVVMRDHGLDFPKYMRTLTHELRHVHQVFVFGVFQPILYGLHSVGLWVYGTIMNADVHAYYDNWFEKDARRAAGQQIKIPREAWRDPKDRWIWW